MGDLRLNASRSYLDAQTRTTDSARATHIRRGEAHQRHEAEGDTEAGMLSGVSRKRRMRSNPCWFTEFCKSQCLSHFAAPFIVVQAETSVAESCKEAINGWCKSTTKEQEHPCEVEVYTDSRRAFALECQLKRSCKLPRAPSDTRETEQESTEAPSRTISHLKVHGEH